MTDGTADLAVAEAYSRTGTAWRDGPARLYDRLAEEVCERSPVPLAGTTVLDLGAGTGAASRAARARAARVVALDASAGMLAVDAGKRPPAAVADARALPLRRRSVDVVVAAFSLNHLDEPAVALAEAARVVRPGGAVLASGYAEDDTHPVKGAVEAAARAAGWREPSWYGDVRQRAAPHLASPERAVASAEAAGLRHASAEVVRVAFPDLQRAEMVAWRLGMAQLAPFLAGLTSEGRRAVADDALERLGPAPPPVVRSMVVLTWRSPPN